MRVSLGIKELVSYILLRGGENNSVDTMLRLPDFIIYCVIERRHK